MEGVESKRHLLQDRLLSDDFLEKEGNNNCNVAMFQGDVQRKVDKLLGGDVSKWSRSNDGR